MNLIEDSWIPVQRESGILQNIAPWQITERDDQIIRLSAPRHDFDGALVQFLIALLQTTITPQNDDEWLEWLLTPPSPETLKEKFIAYQSAFELAGDGPRFMQDFDALDGEEKIISGLMIEAPGGRTEKLFLDHFIKGGSYNGLCQCCAATALFAMQTNAPAGGVGHRTSLRGGGPLTTLVIPDVEAEESLPDTLWTMLWLNVLNQKSVENLTGNVELKESAHIFPWLTHTRTSEAKTGQSTTPLDAHSLQMYWAMPRRIRLVMDGSEHGCCDLCGAEDQALITHYVTKNYGANYDGAWRHPLSPHYQDKKTLEYLPMHAQPGGLAYRYWLGWTQGDGFYQPAKAVREYLDVEGKKTKHEILRLWVFGYDMDNMKARCWYEKQYPLIVIENEEQRQLFAERVQAMLDLATQLAGFVQSCVKEAWFDRPADARGDVSFIKEAFYEQTEAAFIAMLHTLQSNTNREVIQQWHSQLAHHSLKLFDYWVAQGDMASENPRRIAEAHRKLRNLIYGKKLLAKVGIETKKGVAVA